MAKIEDLISEIADARLRDEIAREVAALKKQKKFGLVFEEHIPEMAQLPGLPVKPGLRVVNRSGSNRDVFLVEVLLSGGKARVRRENGEAGEEVAEVKDLVVVKRFGEPVYPTLSPVARLTCAEGKPYHTIINADNFHALQLLLYCYAGQVDVIYIHPPYNTGARDWKYNNDYVDASDQWRHSKWLCFMKKRLALARRLLRPDVGALVVTVDEHEVHHLGVLLEEVFPDAYRQMVTIVVNPKGVTQGRFSRVEEYAHFCFLGQAAVVGRGDDLLTPESDEESESDAPRWKGLLRSGEGARREDRRDMFYPVLVDENRKAVVGAGEPLPLGREPDFDTKINGLTPVWPVRSDGSLGRWGVGPEALRGLASRGYVSLGRYDPFRNTWGISYLSKKLQNQVAAGVLEVASYDETRNVVDVRYTQTPERQVKTVWHRTTHDAGAYGSDLLKAVFGQTGLFSFPKSLHAVKDTLAALSRERREALILDFFAGSGTTYHATALLNAEDGGSRRCILVTNNEVSDKLVKDLNAEGLFPGDAKFEKHGICESVTWPRCKYVTQGQRDDGTPLPGTYLDGREMKQGFEENLEYFRLDFLDPHEVAYGERFEAILPILWLMAGAEGERETARGYGKSFLPRNSPYAVLLKEAAFAEFRVALGKRPDIRLVFLVTDSEEAFREMSADLPGQPETKMLYKSYLDNFRINTEKNL